MSTPGHQIFYDQSGRRSLLVQVALVLLVGSVAFLGTVFVVSIVSSPALPSVALRLEQQYAPTPPSRPVVLSADQPELNLTHIRAGSHERPSPVPRLGFYVNWDENSFVSLRDNAAKLDVLVPEWFHLLSATGDVGLDDPAKQKNTQLWLSVNAPALKVFPLINNYDPKSRRWLGHETGQMLASYRARTRFIRNLKAALAKGRYGGVVLDFKMVPRQYEAQFAKLVRELKFQLLPTGQRVMTVLPAYENPSNFHDLVESSDQVILLTYDQHWSGHVSGPLASQGWFESQLDKRFAKITGHKLIVAVGSYAVDWQATGQGIGISVRTAWDILREAGTSLRFDSKALNPTFAYRDGKSGHDRTVWMLDGVTTYNQIAAALAMKPGGIALWRLGTEDPTVWHSLAKGRAADTKALAALGEIDPGTAVTYKGQGEVLKFSDRRRKGARQFKHKDAYNLIVDQSIVTPPRSTTIERWGYNRDKVIALTFDDGPSRIYTSRILDVLKRKEVKGSFFVVGAAAALEPEILQRIYREGHDIGNHTFTHPDLSAIPAVQLDLELNATQRVLESKLGIHSILFRPPFLKNIEPETERQSRTLYASNALGYITIGQRIDPLDWGRPGADEIVSRTIEYASARQGNVVLLHDGGGDRTQTIEALPRIIDELRAKGFRFVTIHELLGLKRADLMPVLDEKAAYVPYVNDLSFVLAKFLGSALAIVFIIGIVLGVTRLTAVAIAASVQSRRSSHRRFAADAPVGFAVVVPAYNEEKVIVDSVQALLLSDRTDFEIIVVDDGSKDNTASLIKERFAGQPRVSLLTKDNGGKAQALNYAIERIAADVVVCIDADTRLAPDALSKLVRHFTDPNVGAVAGVVTVGNTPNLLTRFQALEYVAAQNLDRRALELANGIGVVPGAIGAWRREALEDVGGYSSDTLAEDADVTIKLQRYGWRIVHDDEAVAMTEAPQTLSDFRKQRFRWMYGTLQVAAKHLAAYRERGASGIKFLTLPNILVFQFAFTLISPVMDIVLVATLLSEAWNLYHDNAAAVSQPAIGIMVYWAGFQLIELAAFYLAFRLHKQRLSLVSVGLIALQRFCYRQLLYWVAIETLLAALRGRLTGWGRIRRFGLEPVTHPDTRIG